MEPFTIAITILLCAFALVLSLCLVCFFKIFFTSRLKREERYPIPDGEIYEEYRERMIGWMMELDRMTCEEVAIRSFDGLTLRGKYYEYKKGAPTEIMFHGYRGSSYRDLCGGVYRAHALGRNALIVDQRASGRSEGHLITFGLYEMRDCIDWVTFYIENIDKDARIILTGISMGAATVMLASGEALPKNVVGVLADCGYSSTRDIIRKVIKDMKLPVSLIYPFARLSAILFGGFDPDKATPKAALERCKIPTIFFHGSADDFVPCYMSEENFAACRAEKKKLVITEGAGHGLCFPRNEKEYLSELENFFDPILNADNESFGLHN